jgi:hypothetical protein
VHHSELERKGSDDVAANVSSGWHASGEGSSEAAAMEKEGVGAVLGRGARPRAGGINGEEAPASNREQGGRGAGQKRSAAMG